MKAKVTKSFRGRPDGDALPRAYGPGDEVVGDLAETAISLGVAEKIKEDEPAPAPAAKPKTSRAKKKG